MSENENDEVFREYIKRDCPFNSTTQSNEYHNWYYKNVRKEKQSEYYRKKREEQRNKKQEPSTIGFIC